jgi:PAS domain S-box-containing protein
MSRLIETTADDFEDLANEVSDLIHVVRPDGSFDYVNRAWRELLGYESGEVSSLSILNIIHADNIEPTRRLLERVFAGERLGRFQATVISKEGRPIDVEGTLSTEFDSGVARKVRAVFRNTSERNGAERDSRRSRALLTAIENAQPYYLAEGDLAAVFEQVLSDFLTLTDSSYGFIGETLIDFDANPWVQAHAIRNLETIENSGDGPTPLESDNAELRDLDTLCGTVVTSKDPVFANAPDSRLARAGMPTGHPEISAFLGLPLKYGNKLVGVVGLANCKSGYDDQMVQYVQPFLTTCAHLIEAYRSRREREFSERALRASEERFRQLADGAPVMIWLSGTDKMACWFNKLWREFTGRSLEQAMGDPWKETVHPEDYSRCRAKYLQSFSSREPFVMEYRLRRDDGTYQWIADHGAPFEVDGHFYGYVGSCMNIDDRVRAEKDRLQFESVMQQTQKLESLGLLAGGVAHDFNNALTLILGHASLAQMELPEDSEAQQVLSRISEAAESASDLTRQMLTYSGKGTLVVENVQLDQIVQDASRLLETVVSRKAQIQLQLEHAPVKADVTKIRQVLMGLATNAAEALKNQGTVLIRTGVRTLTEAELASHSLSEVPASGQYAYIEVCDDGHGMDAGTLTKVFDPFFTTKPDRRGLGLAAVQGIVRSHGGTVIVDSAPDEGTAFTVLLPIAVDGDEENSSCENGNTVLVVDDEDGVRTFMRRALEVGGYRVEVASDGYEGLQSFKRHQRDIGAVVLDWTMPRMSGQEMLHELRSLNNDIPVLVVSGYHDEEVRLIARNEGANQVLGKPFRASELIDRISEMLKKSRVS